MSEFEFFLELDFPSNERAEKVLNAISPELEAEKRLRSSSGVKVKRNTLSIYVQAKDRTALKASVNSVLKGIILSNELLEEV